MNHFRLTAGLAGVALLLVACTGGDPDDPGAGQSGLEQSTDGAVRPPAASLVLAGGGATGMSISASQTVWVSSAAAITSAPDRGSIKEASRLATSLALPVLVLPEATAAPTSPDAAAAAPSPDATSAPAPAEPSGPTQAESAPGSPASASTAAPGARGASVADELERLGAQHVLHVGPGVPQFPGRDVLTTADDLPERGPVGQLESVVVASVKGAATKGSIAAEATIAAAGAQPVRLRDADPRAYPRDVRAIASAQPSVAIGLGARFGDSLDFAQRVATAATGVQLPGGGQTIFDNKRYVALYGHPLTGALGVLGEQGPDEAAERAAQVAEPYRALTDDKIVPAFEVIATVAAGGAGDDGNYSNEWDIDVLRPLVDAAAEAGIYVVLDLQSGRSPFLPQAKLYEELLVEPHVGLALDPEWRLRKGEQPLRQIGSVSAAEINRTLAWLADLTAGRNLPQKMVLLHQFRTDMITERGDLDLSHDELAVIVQMDGDGTLGQKLDTWNALRADAQPGLRFGWKNFYDEDEPTPSPATTFQVAPTPWFVSYQ